MGHSQGVKSEKKEHPVELGLSAGNYSSLFSAKFGRCLFNSREIESRLGSKKKNYVSLRLLRLTLTIFHIW